MIEPRPLPALLRAGRVGRPHGLDGSFYVLEGRPALLAEGALLRMGSRAVRVARCAGTERRPIVRLDGVQSREQAERLRGQELAVERSLAPRPGEQEWWAEELEGCRVHDRARELGLAVRLLELPSCEALEVRDEDGAVLLVPLVRDAVREVDVAGRRIEVDMGFLEGGQTP